MPPRPARPLVALFTAGYLASYLLPTVVSRIGSGLGLTPAHAGLVGSGLLLGSASAGFTLASRVERFGARRVARAGLLLAALGYGLAALSGVLPLVVLGVVLGGFGSGTATTVAASGIAALRDPHRASSAGLLSVSGVAGALYLTLPHFGPGHRLPLLALAVVPLLVWPATRGLADSRPGAVPGESPVPVATGRLPYRRSGLVLALSVAGWSLAQNALWGVSGRIGMEQAGLGEVAVGVVFAVALGGGLLGVLGAGALGSRAGRAAPIGLGTVVIAACIAVSASAHGLGSFAGGEVLWNTGYPVVLSYLIGLAASLDPRGRWAVLVGSASSLGVACGPVTGSLLVESAGFTGMGLVLATALLVLAVPLTAVALHTGGRPLVPGAVRRRGGASAALVAARAGAPSGTIPRIGAPEQTVTEIAVPTADPDRTHFGAAGPERVGG
ncbi:putative transmembrane efflux protein [Streptomyces sp. Tu6071]|uniref:MFS transporter n=1 Tax=unclassified Streptomyces TaxID=2593676 RepID=UPI00020E5E8E|nr:MULTISPECIES: MFS transporter [unclassified Streptomyces]ASY35027.1 MFS transporter [Streptomyces sp. CLI2509]EGJ77472.1 putative transmembrane efflux protein [Streptomyces sp. Tu6071]